MTYKIRLDKTGLSVLNLMDAYCALGNAWLQWKRLQSEPQTCLWLENDKKISICEREYSHWRVLLTTILISHQCLFHQPSEYRWGRLSYQNPHEPWWITQLSVAFLSYAEIAANNTFGQYPFIVPFQIPLMYSSSLQNCWRESTNSSINNFCRQLHPLLGG